MSLFVCVCGIDFVFCKLCLCILVCLDRLELSLYCLIKNHFCLRHRNIVFDFLEGEFEDFDLYGFVQCYLKLAMF
jgi:hypothetical protein